MLLADEILLNFTCVTPFNVLFNIQLLKPPLTPPLEGNKYKGDKA